MTCEHCKEFSGIYVDNGAGAQNLTLEFDTYNNAGCTMPTFCTCECHYINVNGGAQ